MRLVLGALLFLLSGIAFAGCLEEPRSGHVELILLRPAGTAPHGILKLEAESTAIFFRNDTGLGFITPITMGPVDLMEPRLVLWQGEVPPDHYVTVRVAFENGTVTLSDGSQALLRFAGDRISNNFDDPGFEVEVGKRLDVEITSSISRLTENEFLIQG